jgi:hypothetical protein
MAERATVWAVRLGTADEGHKGVLELGDTALTWVPERVGPHEITVPFSDIRRVRRSPASPVIVVERSASAVAFYFVEPPPLRFRSERSRKAKGRLKTMTYLQGRNRTKRVLVKRWATLIKDAAARSL